eukprot:358287-Chlamydomonas_euryale.AAC.17
MPLTVRTQGGVRSSCCYCNVLSATLRKVVYKEGERVCAHSDTLAITLLRLSCQRLSSRLQVQVVVLVQHAQTRSHAARRKPFERARRIRWCVASLFTPLDPDEPSPRPHTVRMSP